MSHARAVEYILDPHHGSRLLSSDASRRREDECCTKPAFIRAVTFEQMLAAYDDDHRHPANRALHLIGIPLIAASIPLLFFVPGVGIALFVLGWTCQLLGHRIEGKPPSFTRDIRYMAVGAAWFVRVITRRPLVARP
jgi:uncharacterized membrane protein YGL010W